MISTLQDKGIPLPVQRVLVAPPRCRMGSISEDERSAQRQRSPLSGRYDTPVNRESAFEILSRRAEQAAANPAQSSDDARPAGQKTADGSSPWGKKINEWLFGTSRRQGAVEAMAKSTMRTMGNQLGKQLLRGVLGSLTGGRKR